MDGKLGDFKGEKQQTKLNSKVSRLQIMGETSALL